MLWFRSLDRIADGVTQRMDRLSGTNRAAGRGREWPWMAGGGGSGAS